MDTTSVARVKLTALTLLIASAFLTTVFHFIALRHGSRQRDHTVAAHDKRMAPLREALPRRGVVGYVTDVKGPAGDPIKRYYLTQYALAPVIVAQFPTYDFVVGDFDDPAKATPPAGYSLRKDFGNGVLLFALERK